MKRLLKAKQVLRAGRMMWMTCQSNRDIFLEPTSSKFERPAGAIREYARQHHSWDTVGDITMNVYAELAR